MNNNPVPSMENANRDELYTSVNSKLTANSIMNIVNNLDTLNGFTNYITYHIIEEDLSVSKYSIDLNNIDELPMMLVIDSPDEFEVNLNSLVYEYITFDKILPKFKLKSNDISDISMLNYYDSSPLRTTVSNPISEDFSRRFPLYRFNGNYSPIFKKVDLFKAPELSNDTIGNYIFDTTLSNFGKVNRLISKVNIDTETLKLKESASVYPQLDEFGYLESSEFIFKSSWDFTFYTKIENKTL